MIFEIDFNREPDDKMLEELGAKLVPIPYALKYGLFDKYEIELNSFEELETLLKKVDFIKKDMYSAIISFDPPVIYLDKDV
jgi:hypothetical protein